MISIEEIEKTISELEGRDTSFANCEKLAYLYIVRDHLKGYQMPAPSALGNYGESEFLHEVDGKNSREVWAIVDELMQTLEVVNPRVYRSVIEKISKIK